MKSKPYLFRGVDNEAAVKELQTQLNLFLREKGKKIIEVDGDFGRATEAALKSFKSEKLGIRYPDGKVGEFTHDMLDKYYPLPLNEKERKGGLKPAAAKQDAGDDDDAKGAKQEPKASRSGKDKKTPLAEPSTERKEDEPKKKSGSGWNLISWASNIFSPKKAKPEDEPASEQGDHPGKEPKRENPGINPKPAKLGINDDSNSRYNNLTGQLADINDLSRDGPANPIKAAVLRMSSGFGDRKRPTRGASYDHEGVDIPAKYGTPVYATMDGKVTFAARAGGYGNFISIDEPGPLSSNYGHLSKILVKRDQLVKKGDLIGLVGSTGISTGPHLHYEVRYNGVPVNPLHHGLVLKPLHQKKPEPPINHYFMAREDREDGLPQSRSLLLLGAADREYDKPFSGQLLNANMLTVPSGKFPSQHAGSNGVPTEKPANTPKSKSPLSWLGL